MTSANNRPEMPTFSFEYLRVWYLRGALARALKKEQRHREVANHYRVAVLPDLERRLLSAEMAAAARALF